MRSVQAMVRLQACAQSCGVLHQCKEGGQTIQGAASSQQPAAGHLLTTGIAVEPSSAASIVSTSPRHRQQICKPSPHDVRAWTRGRRGSLWSSSVAPSSLRRSTAAPTTPDRRLRPRQSPSHKRTTRPVPIFFRTCQVCMEA